MTPTEAQKLTLQKYLHDSLRYRETYEEIYDHILSAIAYQSDNISFEDAINNIICNDFGGSKNLVKIENESKCALVKESFNKYLLFLIGFFKFPALLYTIAGSLLGYYILLQVNLSVVVLEIFLAVLTIVIPWLIAMIRLYNTGYILDTKRKSARDKMFENLAGGPVRLFIILNIWIIKTSSYGVWIGTHPFAITLVLLLCTVYNLALHKLYKDEFKSVLINQP
jgi:hypothetical protein